VKNQKFRYEERKSEKYQKKTHGIFFSQIQKITKEKSRNSETRRHIRIDQLLISLDHQTQKHCKILGTLGVSIIYDFLH
jgi:hypothetical protein